MLLIRCAVLILTHGTRSLACLCVRRVCMYAPRRVWKGHGPSRPSLVEVVRSDFPLARDVFKYIRGHVTNELCDNSEGCRRHCLLMRRPWCSLVERFYAAGGRRSREATTRFPSRLLSVPIRAAGFARGDERRSNQPEVPVEIAHRRRRLPYRRRQTS